MKNLHTFLILLILSALSMFAQPTWNYTNTGANHTILIPDSNAIIVDGFPADSGDYIGVFYDSLGILACGGYSVFDGSITALTAWGSESGNTNGFVIGELFKYKIWQSSTGIEFDAIATYLSGGVFNDSAYYSTNGISGIASLTTDGLVSIALSSVSCNGLSDGSIDITVNSGVPPFTYLWSNGETTEDITALTTGTYSVTITDSQSDEIIRSYFIAEPLELVANLTIYPGGAFMSSAYAEAFTYGGTQPYGYFWNTGATTALIQNLGPGNYEITVTDLNNCSTDTSFSFNPLATAVTDSAFTLFDTCINANIDTAYISNLIYITGTMYIEWTLESGTNNFYITSMYPTITSPGIYYIDLVINCPTKDTLNVILTDIIEITPEVFTGIENTFLSENLRIYPNPSQGIIRVKKSNESIIIKEIEIYNSVGERLNLEFIGNDFNSIKLPQGLFFLNISTNQGKLLRKVIVE